MTICGFILGLAASLIGVSGGSISAMILTLYGTAIHKVVATSAALGVPITIAGVVGYALAGLPQQALMPPLSIGFVSLIGFALMAPVASLTAPFGARLAHALPKRRLEIAFAAFLLLASQPIPPQPRLVGSILPGRFGCLASHWESSCSSPPPLSRAA